MSLFNDKVAKLLAGHEALLMRKNEPVEEGNGVITRYRYPVLTAAHTPVFWRYDLNEETNPFLMERIGMNATLNAGAIKWDGKYLMLVRVEGKYALYTRPQDGFIDTGSGGGIGWALIDDITHAEVGEEKIIDKRYYHTIKEVKNGEGPHPIKTPQGWLHLAHGVRNCAAGLRYVLYMYMTSLDDPTRLIASPAGYFMAPVGEERIGDVSNVLFSNGWIADDDGKVFIYNASSDTRMHVATSTIERLVDYCLRTACLPQLR